ncbi:hypothetical protein GAYE_SCF27MG4688 [Galdieria yellowstonensis]|uniref:Mitogen-activated protein kinase n=1 Tax=Galdieria yellowstonensis TaxID=3028027 RepID=A0AAV9IHR3_9RHOD|nr:hypothetical protein GAYE_SCF27MG4688 [Galdieria yellowstonensis]
MGERNLSRQEKIKHDFFLPPLMQHRYTLEKCIGEGAYGVVCAARDNQTGQRVAIKRVLKVFEDVSEAVRILRELKFLRLLDGHPNVCKLVDVLVPSNKDNFDDVFLVMELMPTDLKRVLTKMPDELSDDHIRWIMYQVFCALNYIHSAKVLHRDLKPNNILINSDCDLRLCDFGLARAEFDSENIVNWTGYVETRWYRAPEIILTNYTRYSTSIDIWSAGCILGEMLNRGVPLFRGTNSPNQLEVIVKLLGKPGPEAISQIRSDRARALLMQMPARTIPKLEEVFPRAHPEALSLLKRLLEFDPRKRPSAAQVLDDPYFAKFRDRNKEFTCKKVCDASEFEFERRRLSAADMRVLFWKEILLYHPELARSQVSSNYEMPSQVEMMRSQWKQTLGKVDSRQYSSLPRERLSEMHDMYQEQIRQASEAVMEHNLESGTGKPPSRGVVEVDNSMANLSVREGGIRKTESSSQGEEPMERTPHVTMGRNR